MKFRLNDIVKHVDYKERYLIIDVFERHSSLYLNKKSHGMYTIKDVNTGESYNVENYYLDQEVYCLVKEPNDIMKDIL